MPETLESPQAQPKAATSGLDRLSRDPEYLFSEDKPATPAVTPEPVKTETVAQETAKLEGETIPEPEKTPETAPITQTPAEEVGFEENTSSQAESEGWKPIIEALGYQIPEDYAEEKGFEVFKQLQQQDFETKLEEVKNYREVELFSDLPENVRDEAKLVYDLFKSGQTLEQINAPIQQIKEWKTLSKEELIRENLKGLPGYTPEVVDHRMNQIIEAGHVDIEYQILINYVNQKENELVQQRQQQIQQNSNYQAQVREQRQQQEFNAFKAALDKVPAFMDRKLSVENKTNVLNDYSNGYVKALTQNPEKLAKFMLYERYGEVGLKYLQDRALEKATVEKAKQEHNIPPVVTGAANAISTATTYKTGIDRLADDERYK